MNKNNIFEVVKKMRDDDNNYFVAVIDGDTGTVITRAWTTQPVNWLEWASKVGAEYLRLRKRGVNPTRAAFAARMSVMANGPSTMRFIDRMDLLRL